MERTDSKRINQQSSTALTIAMLAGALGLALGSAFPTVGGGTGFVAGFVGGFLLSATVLLLSDPQPQRGQYSTHVVSTIVRCPACRVHLCIDVTEQHDTLGSKGE